MSTPASSFSSVLTSLSLFYIHLPKTASTLTCPTIICFRNELVKPALPALPAWLSDLLPSLSLLTSCSTLEPVRRPCEGRAATLGRRRLQSSRTCFKHLLSFQPQSWTSLTSSSRALLPRRLGRPNRLRYLDPPQFRPHDLSTLSSPLPLRPPPPRAQLPLLRQIPPSAPKNQPLKGRLAPPSRRPLRPRANALRHSHRIHSPLRPRSSQSGLNRKMSWSSI